MSKDSLVKRINAAFPWGEQRNIVLLLAEKIESLAAGAGTAEPDLSITYHNTPEPPRLPEHGAPWPSHEGPGVTIDPAAEDAT